MNYCIIRSGNKQYQVQVGSVIELELLNAPVGPVVFDDVLLHVDGDKVEVGTPTLAGFKVYGTVLGNVKADKIQVFKYKSKSRYRKLRGHRQQYTSVKIESLGTAPAKSAPAPAPKKEAKAVKTVKATKPAAKKPTRKKAAAK